MAVTAIKNGVKHTFSDYAWRGLGKNKEGWVPVQGTEQKIKGNLPNGEAKIPVLKPAPAQKIGKVVDDSYNEDVPDNTGKHTPILPPVTEEPKTPEPVVDKIPSEKDKEQFLKSISGLTGAAIKEFFEKDEISHKYVKKGDMHKQLGEYMNYDLDRFANEF